MAERNVVLGERPPSFVSKATLAAELDISASTVDNYVQRGLLPKPVRIGGSARWYWEDVVAALRGRAAESDPFMEGLDYV